MLVGQLCMVLLSEIVGYLVGLIPSHFYLVLGAEPSKRSISEFTSLLVYAFIAMIVIAFLKATKMLITGLLYIYWREILTKHLQKLYFNDPLSVYKVIVLQANRDNPDQRIASDAGAVANDLSQFVPVILISPFTIGYYTYKCQLITGYLGPIAVFSFFIIATFFNKLLMNPVAKWTYRQDEAEGHFRYRHALVRTHCEPSSFYKANLLEKADTDTLLQSLLGTQERLMLWKYAQNMYIGFCDYSVTVLSYAIISIPIFSGNLDDKSGSELSSLISQYSFQSMYLFNCFTTLIDLSKQAAQLLGNSHRVADFLTVLEVNPQRTTTRRHHEDERAQLTEEEELHSSYDILPYDSLDSTLVTLRSVTVSVPKSHRTLISNLTYEFVRGTNVLISGPTGVGKSSLLRVIGQLWKPTSGVVTVYGSVGLGRPICIMPQKPYFSSQSLAKQIYLYGDVPPSDHWLTDYLTRYSLSELVTRCGGLHADPQHTSWYDWLSPGEAQRISFLRILHHCPQLVFMDEFTSQVDLDTEKLMFDDLRDSSITYVTIGHRESVRPYHQTEIHINRDGSWQVKKLD